jgi:hypothetical protein
VHVAVHEAALACGKLTRVLKRGSTYLSEVIMSQQLASHSVSEKSMNDPNAVIAALENAPSIILPLVREVPPEILKRRPQPNKWSAHEHACHLAAVHPLMLSRLDLMLSESCPYIKPYLPDVDDADDALLKVDLDEAMERFVRDRQGLIERLQGLSAEAWQRTAEHGEYSRYSVLIMFRHLAMHDMLHAYRIEELSLKKDWR